MTHRNGPKTDHTPDRGDLDRLLEAEGRMEARLAAAREEARGIIAAAEASAREAEASVAAKADAGVARVRATIEAEAAAELERLATDTRRRIAALEGVSRPRIADLAAYVVDRVVAG